MPTFLEDTRMPRPLPSPAERRDIIERPITVNVIGRHSWAGASLTRGLPLPLDGRRVPKSPTDGFHESDLLTLLELRL